MKPPFARRVEEAMARRGFTLRSFCRAVEMDPSFFSKVLAGKRSPPSEESVLRRIAIQLGLDAPELIVSAGRIPEEWSALWTDSRVFERVHAAATGASPERARPAPRPREAEPARTMRPVPVLADELL